MLGSPENRAKQRCRDVLTSCAPGSRDWEQLQIIFSYFTTTNILPTAMFDARLQHKLTEKLCQGMRIVPIEKNTIIFLQGHSATSYFIVFSGAVDIRQEKDSIIFDTIQKVYNEMTFQPLGANFCRSTFGSHLSRIPENKGFGEEALLENVARAATAVSMSKSELIEISPELYAETLKPFHMAQTRVAQTFPILRKHFLCETVADRVLTDIAYTMKAVRFYPNKVICNKDEQVEDVFLICSGEVGEVKQKSTLQKELSKTVIGPGTFIGAMEQLKGNTTFHREYVAKTIVEAYTIPTNQFEFLLKNQDFSNKLLAFEKALARNSPKPKQPKDLIAAMGNLESLRGIPDSTSPPKLLQTKARSLQFLLSEPSSPPKQLKTARSLQFLLPNSPGRARKVAYSTGSLFEEDQASKQASDFLPTFTEKTVCCEVEQEFKIKLPPALNLQSSKGGNRVCPHMLEAQNSALTFQNGDPKSISQKPSGEESLNLQTSMQTIKEEAALQQYISNDLLATNKKSGETNKAPNNELPPISKTPRPIEHTPRPRNTLGSGKKLNNPSHGLISQNHKNLGESSSTLFHQGTHNVFCNFVQPAKIGTKQALPERVVRAKCTSTCF